MDKKEKNTEQVILQAAEAEFLEMGFAGARTMSIAKRAGVTHAMLHYYFRTKEQLFSSIIKEKATELVNSCVSIFTDTSLPFEQRIEKGMEAHFDFLTRNPQLPRFVLSEVGNISTDMIQDYLPKLLTVFEGLKKETGEDIEPLQLFREIVSLNMFPFLVMPALGKVPSGLIDSEKILEQVKKENITVIKKRLGL